MKEKKYLPLGTVVLLKGAKKKVMITGYLPVDKNKKNVYDYLACIWPIGYLDSETMLAFNEDVINNVYFVGCSDEEQKEFAKELSPHDRNEIKELIDKEKKDNDDFTFQSKE